MASSEGAGHRGGGREDAREDPQVAIDPAKGLTDAEADDVARKIGVPAASVPQARAVFQGLYKVFDETDASLAEINPLIVTGDGRVVALDAKLNFDSNALFRHPEIVAMRDLDEEGPGRDRGIEVRLSYISLNGNIVHWSTAPARVATWDTDHLFGAEPANFLDVGVAATNREGHRGRSRSCSQPR